MGGLEASRLLLITPFILWVPLFRCELSTEPPEAVVPGEKSEIVEGVAFLPTGKSHLFSYTFTGFIAAKDWKTCLLCLPIISIIRRR